MKLKQVREAMAIPLDSLPEQELCAYEKLREDNIRERETAMAKCNFFENLNEIKKTMGLSGHAKVLGGKLNK